MAALLTKVPPPIRRLFWSVYGRSVWDAEHRDSSFPVIRQIIDLVIQDRRGPETRVLDAGCGTGMYARALAEQECQVTAIDIAPGMLVHARRRAKTLPTGCQGSLTVDAVSVEGSLPYPDASFDVALLVSVLQAVDDPERTLREIHRVLVPEGTLYVVYFLPHPNTALPLRDELAVRGQPLRPTGLIMRMWQLALMALKSSIERQGITHQWTPDDLRTLVTGAGYVVQVEQTQHWVVVKSSCRKVIC